MARVVIALFEDMGTAQNAQRALEAGGFERDNIDLRSGDQLIGSTGAARAGQDDGGFLSSLGEDGLRGISATDVLIAVEVPDDMAEQAAEIMDGQGATEQVQIGRQAASEAGQAKRPGGERDFASYDREFQDDWQANYARASGLKYDDVLPGYRYGYDLGRNPQYRGADWARVEPHAKRNWDAGKHGPWERVKQAVKSAWERVRQKV